MSNTLSEREITSTPPKQQHSRFIDFLNSPKDLVLQGDLTQLHKGYIVYKQSREHCLLELHY